MAQATEKYKFNVPPSTELHYIISAKQSGIPLDGSALVKWNVSGASFQLSSEARSSLLGKILDSKSEGAIDQYGLAPALSTEKRWRKQATTASFDRQNKLITFSASDANYPIKGGEQDRNSVIWQLISVARAVPAKFVPGSSWTFFVVGQRDAEPWIFKVVKQEKITTPLGDMGSLHVIRLPPPDSKGQQLDIWLAPGREWYPVRMRFTDPDRDYIEQSLVEVGKPAS